MAIQKLAQEDPTFRVATDPETGQTILSGMGELHLEIIVDRMMREFGVGANVGKPQVAYRETIRKNAEAEGRHVKQTGGHGQYGVVKIRVEPLPTGAASSSSTRFTADRFRRNTSSRSKRASRKRWKAAFWPAIPMSDLKVTLYDGSYHDVDSSEMAFKIAGSLAIKEAARQRQAGAARADHGGGSGGAGRVHGRRDRRPEFAPRAHRRHGAARHHADHQSHRCRFRRCSATRPSLRSRTQGRGSFTMHFGKYEEVPGGAGRGDREQGSRDYEVTQI